MGLHEFHNNASLTVTALVLAIITAPLNRGKYYGELANSPSYSLRTTVLLIIIYIILNLGFSVAMDLNYLICISRSIYPFYILLLFISGWPLINRPINSDKMVKLSLLTEVVSFILMMIFQYYAFLSFTGVAFIHMALILVLGVTFSPRVILYLKQFKKRLEAKRLAEDENIQMLQTNLELEKKFSETLYLSETSALDKNLIHLVIQKVETEQKVNKKSAVELLSYFSKHLRNHISDPSSNFIRLSSELKSIYDFRKMYAHINPSFELTISADLQETDDHNITAHLLFPFIKTAVRYSAQNKSSQLDVSLKIDDEIIYVNLVFIGLDKLKLINLKADQFMSRIITSANSNDLIELIKPKEVLLTLHTSRYGI